MRPWSFVVSHDAGTTSERSWGEQATRDCVTLVSTRECCCCVFGVMTFGGVFVSIPAPAKEMVRPWATRWPCVRKAYQRRLQRPVRRTGKRQTKRRHTRSRYKNYERCVFKSSDRTEVARDILGKSAGVGPFSSSQKSHVRHGESILRWIRGQSPSHKATARQAEDRG
jgi:hypothetical protein